MSWPPFENIFFASSPLLLNRKANWLEIWQEASGWLEDQQEGHHGSISLTWIMLYIASIANRDAVLKVIVTLTMTFSLTVILQNLFWASSPEQKGQLTRNLVGSIWVTCRSTRGSSGPYISDLNHVIHSIANRDAVLKVMVTLSMTFALRVIFWSE